MRIDRAWIGEFGDFGAVGKHRGELEVEALDDKSAVVRVLFWGRFLFFGAEVGVDVSWWQDRRLWAGAFIVGCGRGIGTA